jgi:hypothetical protein
MGWDRSGCSLGIGSFELPQIENEPSNPNEVEDDEWIDNAVGHIGLYNRPRRAGLVRC